MSEKTLTEANKPQETREGRAFDGAYGFSFAIALGLILFIAGLALMVSLGMSTGTGMVFGLPLLVAGLIVPLFMVREMFTRDEISGPCPYCGATVKTTNATIKMNCPECKKIIAVRDLNYHQTEDGTTKG